MNQMNEMNIKIEVKGTEQIKNFQYGDITYVSKEDGAVKYISYLKYKDVETPKNCCMIMKICGHVVLVEKITEELDAVRETIVRMHLVPAIQEAYTHSHNPWTGKPFICIYDDGSVK